MLAIYIKERLVYFDTCIESLKQIYPAVKMFRPPRSRSSRRFIRQNVVRDYNLTSTESPTERFDRNSDFTPNRRGFWHFIFSLYIFIY